MVDTHVHLTMDEFNEDRESIVTNFAQDGIRFAIEVGFDIHSSSKAIEFAAKHGKIYASVGIHPHDVKNVKSTFVDDLHKMGKNEKVVAIGEIGLDYYRDLSPRELQKKYFEMQLEIAEKSGMPVILHIRDAYSDAYEIVKAFNVIGVVHSFNGTKDDLKNFLDRGFYIGVGGISTYRKNDDLRETLGLATVDRILTETDCPYLSPQTVRGKRNEPKYVRFAVETLSTIFNMPFEDVESRTSENAMNLFRIKGENLRAC